MNPPLSPLERYEQDLARSDFRRDPAQAQAVALLQDLYLRLLADTKEPDGWLSKWFKREPRHPVRGLYLWGGVGRGKTYLMDCFYESLPFTQKMRVHFHRFMRRVHGELKVFAGHKNPLQKVADTIAAETKVICFDEFFVSDITDAMILGNLMEALFARGVVLVATSNVEPDSLYKDGLQRSRFLPAIALLKTHTQVVNIDGGIDYRLRALEQAELFHWPLDETADRSLMESFRSLIPKPDEFEKDVIIEIEGRGIPARYRAEGVIWFDFPALCDGPRSQNDYIEVAREFHSVILSNLPELGADREDQARRFINLVDEFYDRHIKLVLSSARRLTEIYSGGRLEFEFQRTTSRLLEMQSRDYLAKPHLC